MRHIDPRRNDGFTLIELLIVVAIIGIIAAIAIPGLLRARMSANETSAIGTLKAVNSAQATFATACGRGFFASTINELTVPPGPGDPPFLPVDLSMGVAGSKSGYNLSMAGTAVGAGAPASCNGATLVGGYYSQASPVSPGQTGQRFFWTNASNALYMQFATFTSTNISGPPVGDAGAMPLQ